MNLQTVCKPFAERTTFDDCIQRFGVPLELGVSGGPDSLAMLALARAAGHDCHAHYVDHGLRASSLADASLVAHAADALGASFSRTTVDVGDGPNLEARARDARRAALPNTVLLGHTVDDQAETLLMFLMRGTGPAGISGISPVRRPILRLRRFETQQICSELGLDTVDDEMNGDPRFVRTRIRNELLPLMNNIADRDVSVLLARFATLQERLLATDDRLGCDDLFAIDPQSCEELVSLPLGYRRAVIRKWVQDATNQDYGLDVAACERIDAVVEQKIVATQVMGGWTIRRSNGRLSIRASEPPLENS